MKADLVLFDPASVIDRSTFEDPTALSAGIALVAVNGQRVWENGKATGATPGRVLPEGAGAAVAPADAGGVPAAKVDAVFGPFDSSDSPGCALAVLREGRVIFQRGYGMASLELSVPITPETVFDIGSSEKQFAATAMLLLQQDGKLSLSDDIRKFLPEIPSYGTTITIDHLLRHTSGLRDYIGLLELAGHRTEDVTTDEDALFLIARQKALEFPPGTRHRYSNTGYFLLSQIVRRASGQTLAQFASERILRPLSMTSSVYLDDHTQIVPGRATAYSPGRGGGFRLDTSNWEQTGDGGLQTSVLDLARWDENFYSPRVGGERLVTELQAPGVLSDGRPLTYARGLRVDEYRGLKRVAHGGSWAGYRAQLLRFPQWHFSVIILCNLSTAGPGDRATKVAELYLAEHMRPGEKPTGAAAGALSDFDRERWSGLYWNAETDDLLRIRAEKEKLLARHGEGKEYELVAAQPGGLVPKDNPDSVRMVLSPNRNRTLRLEEKDESFLYTEVEEVSPGVKTLAGYSGSYYSEELDASYALRLENDQLRLRRRGAKTSTLRPVFADAFLDPEAGLLHFVRDAQGRISGFEVAVGRSKIFFGPVAGESR